MSEAAEALNSTPGQFGARLLPDEVLARRVARGDERAFSVIFERHQQAIYRYCHAILRNPHDAQDALQSTMLKAFTALQDERREIAIKPWLFRIAHNQAIDLARRRRDSTAVDPELPDPEGAVQDRIASKQRLRELVHDLNQLPERQRSALVMRELNDLAIVEIAQALSISVAAAKQTIYEARVGLAEMRAGRELDCEEVMEAISAGDRRVMRGRRIRAHVRGCERCRDFDAAIAMRRHDLAVLAPPLAAPAALAALHGVLGVGGGGATSAAGASVAGGAAAGIGTAAAIKGAAAVLAVTALAGGAAELAGVIDVRGSDSGGQPTASPQSTSNGMDAVANPAHDAGAGSRRQRRSTDGAADHESTHRTRAAHDKPGKHKSSQPTAEAAPPAAGDGPSASAQPAQPAAPGQSGTAPGQSGATPGQSSSTPGQAAQTPSAGAAPPGQAGTSPGQAGTSPGQAATSPGQAGSTPGQTGTAGSSGSAPGQLK